MDKDVESRLREKFALIDKSDPDQIAEAQKVIIQSLTTNLKIDC